MISNHLEGEALHDKLKNVYKFEIECLCLNSEFMSIFELLKDLETYKRLKHDFPSNVVLKESLEHSEDKPYYECSLFCEKKESDKFELVLLDRGIKIDLYHNYE